MCVKHLGPPLEAVDQRSRDENSIRVANRESFVPAAFHEAFTNLPDSANCCLHTGKNLPRLTKHLVKYERTRIPTEIITSILFRLNNILVSQRSCLLTRISNRILVTSRITPKCFLARSYFTKHSVNPIESLFPAP